LVADIWGKDVSQTAALRNVRFRYEIEAKDVDFRVNTFTSKWEDMEDMLARGTLSAFNTTTDDDITEDVRKSWDQTKQGNHDGVCRQRGHQLYSWCYKLSPSLPASSEGTPA
jgi:hypothetical protein